MATTKYFYENKCNENEKSVFLRSNGWVNNFMRRNRFLLNHKTTTRQQDPERLIDKFMLHILHAHRLSIKYKYPPSSVIAMDETSASNDMVSNTTIHNQGANICLFEDNWA